MKLTRITDIYRLITLIGVISIAIGNTFIAHALPTEHYAEHSVLSSGKWYKISVTQSGIHEISYSQLKNWGFSDPSRVRIYG